MDKVLTISIAAYNVAKYLDRTISSLTNNVSVIEALDIIIVDDGSKDETSIIGKKWEKKYPDSVRVITKENGGYGTTVNTALKNARGKYFKLLDGDDFFNSNNIEQYVKFLSDSEADLVISPYCLFFENKQEFKYIDNHIALGIGEVCSISKARFNSGVVMHEIAVKTNLLVRFGVNLPSHVCYTDNEFVFICFLVCDTVSRCPFSVYNYVIGVEGQSVSIEGERKHFKDNIVVAMEMYELYKNYKSKVNWNDFLIEEKLLMVTDNVYSAFMVLNGPDEYKKELIEFDRRIKSKYSDIYSLSNKITKVKVLRLLKFRLYNLMCKIVLHNTLNAKE